ncbi:MAG: hypothetical protein CM1200mP26_11390 [Acidimicrobiales bacterium]|nr:MAG: hypothetical protein CM1200mP26_11390 [Acidimicrobiales bacterium]
MTDPAVAEIGGVDEVATGATGTDVTKVAKVPRKARKATDGPAAEAKGPTWWKGGPQYRPEALGAPSQEPSGHRYR